MSLHTTCKPGTATLVSDSYLPFTQPHNLQTMHSHGCQWWFPSLHTTCKPGLCPWEIWTFLHFTAPNLMHMPYPALPAQYMHVQWNVQSASLCIFQNIQQAKESQIAYTLNMKELSLSLSVYFLSPGQSNISNPPPPSLAPGQQLWGCRRASCSCPHPNAARVWPHLVAPFAWPRTVPAQSPPQTTLKRGQIIAAARVWPRPVTPFVWPAKSPPQTTLTRREKIIANATV